MDNVLVLMTGVDTLSLCGYLSQSESIFARTALVLGPISATLNDVLLEVMDMECLSKSTA